MLIEMEHPTIGKLPLVGSMLKFSKTPVGYKLPLPRLGQHTENILKELLGYSANRIQELFNKQVVS